MSTTASATSAPKLSETRPDRERGLSAFVDGCSWLDRPADFAPDTWLVVLIDERTRWLEAERHGHSRGTVLRDSPLDLPTVGELPAEWIVPVVEDVKARDPRWDLAGDDDQRAHDRLDAHFRRRQAARAAEVADRQAREADEARRRADVDRETHERAVEQTRAFYGLDSTPN
jgi:hypothetical protein